MNDYIYSLDFKVRDYECDLQGIVNNSVYMNYLEHARHEFIKLYNIDFYELSLQEIYPVVYDARLQFKHSLKSGDEFCVKIRCRREGALKVVFEQDVYRKKDQKWMLKGEVTSVVTKNGRPIRPDGIFDALFQKLED